MPPGILRHKFNVLGIEIDAINLNSACEKIDQWIQKKNPVYICVAPVSTVIDCQDDPVYRTVINSADMVTPDGMPIVWLGRTTNKSIQRTYGPDLMLAVCEKGLAHGYRHFLYGATPSTLQRLESRLKNQFPGINIVGSFSPPFSPTAKKEEQATLATMNQSGADILWVGLGSPKQDFWMQMHRARLEVPVMIGVGAAFDFLSGVKPQAPRFLQACGLEWFFRLSCEPRRLGRRYLIKNSRFLFLLLVNFFRKDR